MKAIVLESRKNAAVMVLECGALWLTPKHRLVVSQPLGDIVAAKYNLDTVGEKDLEGTKKWRLEKVEPETPGNKATSKKAPVKQKEETASESIEDSKSTKDMGAKKAKKKTKTKKKASS